MPAPYYTPKAERLANLIDAELAADPMDGFELGDAEADEAREAEADYFETWLDEAEADRYALEDF